VRAGRRGYGATPGLLISVRTPSRRQARLLLPLAAVLTLGCVGALGQTAVPAAVPSHSDERPKRIFVQGTSASLMAELVRKLGGRITHKLDIIDGVGGLLPASQLEALRATPGVGRIIDDLDPPEGLEREAPPAAPCSVAGALDLRRTDSELRWRLFNKGSTPARALRMTLEWPAAWGELRAIEADGTALPLEPDGDGRHQLSAIFSDSAHIPAVPAESSTELVLRFSTPPPAAGDAQNALTWSVGFSDSCEAKLVPAYSDYANNSYYPQVVGADALHRLGVTGRGVTVAVIDSGLWEHPALTHDSMGFNRVLARYNAITNRMNDVLDESGHGTHITATLMQSEPVRSPDIEPGSYKGIAPDARIVAVKAFNYDGQADFLDLVRAIQFVVENREKLDVRVLNLSFAARPRWQYWLDPVNQAVMRAWAAGIVVVAAAGNEGPEPMTIGAPGNTPYVITVGAVTDSWTPSDRRDDYIPDFSSVGPTPEGHIKPDLVAPGGHIPGFTRPHARLLKDHPEYQLSSGAFVMTGSSQASAVVAGIAALLIQIEPTLMPDQVKCLLTSGAEPAIHPDGRLAYSPFKQGFGYANAVRSVTLGQRDCGNRGLSIENELHGLQHFEGPAVVKDDGKITLPGLDTLLNPSAERETERPATIYWGAKEFVELSETEHSRTMFIIDWESIYTKEQKTTHEPNHLKTE
jgi:serine protease AprX